MLLGLGSIVLYGQQTICAAAIKTYKVDETENSGDGTTNSTYQWTVLESNFSGNIRPLTSSGNQIEIDWSNTPIGTYTLEVIENNVCGNDRKQLTVTIQNQLNAEIDPKFYLCPTMDDSVILFVNGTFDAYEWYNENNNLIGTEETLIATTSGKYSVKVKSASCEALLETEVVLVEFPTFSVNSDLDNSMIIVSAGGNTSVLYQLENLNGTVVKPWQSSNTFFNVPQGQYLIKIKSDNGDCITSLEAEALVIPNAITPNGDGINDYWDLSKHLKNYPDAVVEIFDRYGKKLRVLTIKDDFKWDGKLNGTPMTTENYWYLIKLNDKQTKSGSILLKNK